MKLRPVRVVSLLVLAIWASPVVAEVTDDEVQAAIDRGVQYLLGQQRPNGLFTDTGEIRWDPAGRPIRGANECWVMVGLAFAGLDMDNEVMKKGFETMLKLDLDMTYAVAPRVIAIARMYRKLRPEPKELAKAVMKRDLAWLVKAQGAEGQWDYPSLDGRSSTHWDFSNTQMAILAFHEAILAGFELPNEPLLKAQTLYVDRQLPDGGWNYGSRGGFQAGDNPNGSYGSMTAAAVASLYITRDYLYRGLGCPCSGGRSRLRPNKVDRAIHRGVQWLAKHFVTHQNPRGNPRRWTLYWLYSCERVGLAAGIKYFGAHNWYAEGAEYLVRHQGRDGRWHIGGEHPSDTVYAICFLVKGRAPILVNKLQFDGQWDNHPRDIANLVAYVGKQKEQPVQWQVIHLDTPVEEWHDAPILYITAETEIPLTDDHKVKLRRFTDTGGTILFEASCGNRKVARWWETLCKDLWPEWELKALDRKHPVYTSDQKILRRLPRVREMHDGLRTILFYASTDISCPWNTMAVARRAELFDFGANLYAYATDRGPLRARLASKRGPGDGKYAATISAGPRKTIAVARVKHGGDYYVACNYKALDTLAGHLGRTAQLAVSDAGDMAAADLKPDQVQVAHLTGRQAVTMAEADLKALTDYLKAGGFLLAEAALGDRRFDEALRPLLAQAGAQLKKLPEDHALLTGRMAGAAGYAVKAVKFKPTLLAERVGRRVPEVHGITLDGKLVGLYSPFDLMYAQTGYDAWGSRGYGEEDARAMLANIFLFVSSR